MSCITVSYVQDFLIDTLRKTDQWYVCCILPQQPGKLLGAISPHSDKLQTEVIKHGHIDVPLVRAQLQRADIVPATRIYKQGQSTAHVAACVQ